MTFARRETLFALLIPVGVSLFALRLAHLVPESALFREHFRPQIETVTPMVMPPLRAAPSRPTRAAEPSPVAVVEPAATVVSAQPSAPVRPSTEALESLEVGTVTRYVDTYEDGWRWDDARWRSWWATRQEYWRSYYLRRQFERVAPAIQRMRMLQALGAQAFFSGAGAFDPSAFSQADSCGPFPCGYGSSGASSAPRPQPSTSAPQTVATARLIEGRWVLENTHTRLITAAQERCAVQSSSNGSSSAIAFDTPEGLRDCAVSPVLFEGGAALVLDWRGEGWTQRATITLAHDGARPEATLATERLRSDGTRFLTLTNLGSAPRTWTFGGRDVTVEPGDAARVENGAL